MEIEMNTFVASYESMTRAEAKARAAGWDGAEGEMLDYIDFHDTDIARAFPNQGMALAWLKKELDANKSLFGCGDIDEIETVDPRKRCRYCICRGKRTVRSWIATHEGIEEER